MAVRANLEQAGRGGASHDVQNFFLPFQLDLDEGGPRGWRGRVSTVVDGGGVVACCARGRCREGTASMPEGVSYEYGFRVRGGGKGGDMCRVCGCSNMEKIAYTTTFQLLGTQPAAHRGSPTFDSTTESLDRSACTRTSQKTMRTAAAAAVRLPDCILGLGHSRTRFCVSFYHTGIIQLIIAEAHLARAMTARTLTHTTTRSP